MRGKNMKYIRSTNSKRELSFQHTKNRKGIRKIARLFSAFLLVVSSIYTFSHSRPIYALDVIDVMSDISQIIPSSTATYIIDDMNVLWGWGFNWGGQLGDGTGLDKSRPVKILENVTKVEESFNSVFALTGDGSLLAWGSMSGFGVGNYYNVLEPIEILQNVNSFVLSEGLLFAITTDNKLYGWGNNELGQLGVGTVERPSNPVEIMSNVSKIESTWGTTFAITTDQILYGWGRNNFGQIGNGTTENQLLPVEVSQGVFDVTSNGNTTFATRIDGTLWGWGNNQYGQVGDGTTYNRKIPIKVLDNVNSVSLSSSSSYAILNNGSLWAWGRNHVGQLGIGSGLYYVRPTKVIDNVKSVSLDISSCFAIVSDGSLWSWGYNYSGQLGDGTTMTRNKPVKILDYVSSVKVDSPGTTSSSVYAILENGSLWTWGRSRGMYDDSISVYPVLVMDNVSNVYTSLQSTSIYVKKNNNEIWAWGFNRYGQAGIYGYNQEIAQPHKITNSVDYVTNVSITPDSMFVIKKDDSLWTWGSNNYGQLGDGTMNRKNAPSKLMENIDSVSYSNGSVLAINSSRTLFGWGANYSGQLGLGNTDNRLTPQQIMDDVTSAYTSDGSSFGINSEYELYGWGNNSFGQLGTGDILSRLVPTKVLSNISNIFSISGTTFAITTDHKLLSWGGNDYGQLGNGDKINQHVPIEIMSNVRFVVSSGYTTFAITTDHKLFGWGRNDYGQIGNGDKINQLHPIEIISDVKSVVSNGYTTFAIKSDNSMWGWGKNNYGQLGLGTTYDYLLPTYILDNIEGVQLTEYNTFAVTTGKNLLGWGMNTNYAFSDKYVSSFFSSPLHLLADVEMIYSSPGTYFAKKSDDSLWGWGINADGRLGIGDNNYSSNPLPVFWGEGNFLDTPFSAIEIYNQPDKIEYWKGEVIDTSGGILSLNILNSYSIEIPFLDHMIVDYVRDFSVFGEKEIGVKYAGFEIKLIINQYLVKGIEDGKYYNTDREILYGPNTIVKIDDLTIPSGIVISGEGQYNVLITDFKSNIYNWVFWIDKTPPTITVEDYSILPTNQDVTVTASTNEGTLNKTSHTFTENGSFTFIATDEAGNVSEKTVTISHIDKTAPVITIAPYNLEPTNQDIMVVASINEGTLNATSHTFTENGSFTFIATDEAGNVSEKTVTITNIDRNTPSVSGVSQGAYYNSNRTITFDKGTATLNGVQFISGTTISQEGSYELIVTDDAGNTTSVSFVIDKTAPVISGVEHNQFYNRDRTITFNEGSGLLNGVQFNTGTEVTAEGTYVLIVTDLAGNQTTINFVIDKTAPVITIGSYSTLPTNQDVTVTASTNEGTLNNTSHTFTENGSFTFIATDEAGNVSEKTVFISHIDKIAPVISGVVDGSYYNISVKPTFNEGMAMLNGNPFVSSTLIETEGSYVLIVTDDAGNTTSASFVIDKTAPVISGVEHNRFYNSDRTITFSEGSGLLNGVQFETGMTVSVEGSYVLTVTDLAGNETTVSFVLDKTAPMITIAPYNLEPTNQDITVVASVNEGTLNSTSHTFTENGSFTFIATDEAGNVSEKTVTITNIDRNAPSVSGVSQGAYYNNNRTITFDKGTATLNGLVYISGTTVSQEGSYELIVTDDAGNTTSVSFVIDKTAPVISGVEHNQFYNRDRTITFNEGSGLLNGVQFNTGTEVTAEGTYVLDVTDLAGNQTTINFVIDKTAPVITIGSYSTLPTNQDVTVTASTNEGTLNQTSHTFTANGSFTFIATDLAGNVSEKTVTISHIDKIAPVISGVVEGSYYNISVKPTFNEEMAMLNGNLFVSSTLIEAEGSYVLSVTDDAGNTTSVSFVIDKTAPEITIEPYSLEPANQNVTVMASTNEGTLNQTSHTFTDNGSFTFIATDLAGNVTEETVTITHIVSPTQVKTISISQLPTKLNYIQGVDLDPTGGQISVITYEGSVSTLPLTAGMLSGYDPYSPVYGPQTVTVTYQGVSTTFEVYLNRFIDVPYGHRNYTHINALVGLGIINGYSDNTFRPNNTLTRAQAAIMIVRAIGLSTEGVSSNFTDVPPTHAAYKFISAAYQAGIINGYSDGTFRPNANVTRAQIAIMVQRAFNVQASGTIITFTDVPDGYAPKRFIETLASQKIVNGYSDGTFKPLNNVTRAQFSTMIYNAIQYAQKRTAEQR
jgi:alpha-tubulin suppressor-like RCC1 family protein